MCGLTTRRCCTTIFLICVTSAIFLMFTYLGKNLPKKKIKMLECGKYDRMYNTDYLNGSMVINIGNNSSYLQEMSGSNKSLTVVTAYINIGKYEKNTKGTYRTLNDYVQWAEPYKYMLNPLVVYTDCPRFEKLIIDLRNHSELQTKIIRINKKIFWPFSLQRRIDKLYQTPGYPKFYPGTVYADYACAVHSKFPILTNAFTYFNTSFYCWLDTGYLKYLRDRNKYFTLDVPKDFDPSKIGVTRIYNSNLKNITAKFIIYHHLSWIAGGIFLGIPDTISKFEKLYHRTILRFLDQNLMSSEQQILYAMYSDEERTKHPIDVDFQLYIPRTENVPHPSPWHYLGYLMYHEK